MQLTYFDDHWYNVRIKMSPTAHHHTPASCTELYELVTAVLTMLQGLHALGLVHRDIRLANVLRDGTRWIVTDWELAGRAPQAVKYDIKRLPPDVKDGIGIVHYSTSTDLWQVRKALALVLNSKYLLWLFFGVSSCLVSLRNADLDHEVGRLVHGVFACTGCLRLQSGKQGIIRCTVECADIVAENVHDKQQPGSTWLPALQ